MEKILIPTRFEQRSALPVVAPLALITLLLLILLAGGVYVGWHRYYEVRSQAHIKAENAVRSIAEHAGWLIKASQQTLLRINENIVDPTDATTWKVKNLREMLTALPPEAMILTTDDTGRITFFPTEKGEGPKYVNDRLYFQELAGGQTWSISPQITSRVGQKGKIFTVGYRMERNGKFAGTAIIGIPLSAVVDFYASLNFGPASQVGIFSEDGWMVTRYPETAYAYSIGEEKEWPTIARSKQAFIDAAEQNFFIASLHLTNLPLFAIVKYNRDEALQSFYETLWPLVFGGGAGFAILVALSVGLFQLIQRETAFREDMSRAFLLKEHSDVGVRLALEAGQLGLWQVTLPDKHCRVSKIMAQMLGLSSTEGVVIPPEQWPSLIHPEDFARATGALEATITQNKVLSEIYRVRRQDGEYRWTANKGQLIHNREGKPVTVLGVTEDITEAKQAEARQRLLIAELDHRVKNTLATVQSVAQQSLGKGPQTDSFVGRIAALAKAHSLLAETQWKGASLHALITRQFGPYTQENPKRVTFDGPNLLLDARTTQSLCFILHELTTNAAKYGALSQPSGRVHIQWQIEDETAPIVHLTWREEGIEGVTPPSRQGFGTTLIQSSVAHELNGTLHMNFTAMGLLCEISFPLPALQIAPREQAEPAAAKSKPSADRHGARGKRILIVEDSVLVALDIEGQLRDNGAVPVGPAYMLETAMSLAREEQLDAALLDVNISGRTIFPVAQILRARNIPFIFLSGYGEPDIWPAEWRGYDRLSKPIQSGELSEALDALFMQAHAIS